MFYKKEVPQIRDSNGRRNLCKSVPPVYSSAEATEKLAKLATMTG